MSPTSLVSVIIPSYNMDRYLCDAITSVQRQTWQEIEIVVVDDGSTDRTVDMVTDIARTDSRTRLFQKKNAGLSAARNTGLGYATGAFISFLDADDLLLPDKIERQLEFLNLFPESDLVYSDHYIGNDRLTPLYYERTEPPLMPTRRYLAYKNVFPPFSPLMRSQLVSATGLFDETLTSCEDWDYWIRASSAGLFVYLPGAVGVYRTHAGQMHNNRTRMQHNQVKVIDKHFPEGSVERQIAGACTSWADALHAWAEGNLTTMTVTMLRAAWQAGSWPGFRNVVRFSRYG